MELPSCNNSAQPPQPTHIIAYTVGLVDYISATCSQAVPVKLANKEMTKFCILNLGGGGGGGGF